MRNPELISLLVVNYRCAALTRDAIRTARAASSAPLQVVIVDNSCDPGEAEALRGIADTLIVSDRNRGYAGGINLGRVSCAGEALIVTNPDVTFDAMAIDRLVEALERAAVAGPSLSWDEAHRWILPPGDPYTGRSRLDAILAGRLHAWRARRDRRRFLQRVQFWTLETTTPVAMLSGAVMAIRASTFDQLGGFDERFPLYFEETDFMRRVTEHRERIVYVPAARCRHLHNQSAVQIAEEAAERYGQSEKRYLEKWNGPLAAQLLKRLERPLSPQPAQSTGGPVALDGMFDGKLDSAEVVVEASPLASFETAAGYLPRPGDGREIDVPDNAWTAPVIYLRTVVRTSGEVLATYARRRS